MNKKTPNKTSHYYIIEAFKHIYRFITLRLVVSTLRK